MFGPGYSLERKIARGLSPIFLRLSPVVLTLMTSERMKTVDPLDSRYRGVGGWLAFLIVQLVLLNPLVFLSGILSESESLAQYFNRAPHLPVIVRVIIALWSCLIVFSVYAGISLWSVWPNAVRVAKSFFVCLFIVSLVVPFLPLTVVLPESLHDKILDQVWYGVPLRLIYPTIWYSYLTFSRRVSRTYS